MQNLKIASAVALALGGVSVAHAFAVPTTAQCSGTANQIYIAGSSAVQKALFKDLDAGLFGSASAYYKSSNGNFQILCGTDASNNIVAVHYRAEGGSVVGALPLVPPAHSIKFLDLSGAGAATQYPNSTTVTTTGSSASNGTNDSWGGAVTPHLVDVGITDVEPTQFVGANYPTLYSPAVFGSATKTQFAALNTNPLVDQVFGIFVNTAGLNGGGTGQAINLTREAVANILDGTYTDWSQVPGAAGGVVSSSAHAINVVNREAGSGSRTQASIYFLDYNCYQTNRPINDPTPGSDSYATADALAAAGATNGSITYASIDNAGATNLSLASLQGVAPTNLAATGGQYDDWYEARLIKSGTTLNAVTQNVYNYLLNTLPTVAKAPQTSDILATPGAGSPANAVAVPVVATGIIYTNPYGRSGNSCGTPAFK